MDKLIPDPPEPTTPLEAAMSAEDLARNREAAKRALDFYLVPDFGKPRNVSTMFMICPNVDTESLLAHACESLASANTMSTHFANELGGEQRNTALAIQQIVMLAQLAVNRALDRIDPRA